MTQRRPQPRLEIFEFPVRKAFEKRYDALSDFRLADVSLAEAIGSNGGVVDRIISKEARPQIGITAIHADPNSVARSKVIVLPVALSWSE